MKINWNDIAFTNKSEVKSKHYIFIAGFREISSKRLLDIIKNYITKGNILIGVSKEAYIDGFTDQPQFKSMSSNKIIKLVEKLNTKILPNSIDILEYSQIDLPIILQKITPSLVLLINGSWSKTFHLRPEFYELIKNNIKYKLISPFVSEEEAKEYKKNITLEIDRKINIDTSNTYTNNELLELANKVAKKSFDWTYQIGAVLAKNNKIILYSYNKVLPYSTYAMHFGSKREKAFSPAGDLNNYDTIHAEASLIVEAGKKGIDLKDTTLYINLLPCPTCAKLIAESEIKEITYSQDHSEGYAVKLLESMGKVVRRIVL